MIFGMISGQFSAVISRCFGDISNGAVLDITVQTVPESNP